MQRVARGASASPRRGRQPSRSASGRSARSATYVVVTRSGSAMASEWLSRSSPSTERPSARSVNLRHSVSRSTWVPSTQLFATVCAAWAMCPPNSRTWCLVKIGCSARRRRSQGSWVRSNRFGPSNWRNSRCMRVLSACSPLRPRMSRAPCGEVATTIGGISHLGPSLSRVTGPPASRNVSSPVWKALIALTCWRYGNGFTGTKGSSFTATSSIVSTMAFLQFI